MKTIGFGCKFVWYMAWTGKWSAISTSLAWKYTSLRHLGNRFFRPCQWPYKNSRIFGGAVMMGACLLLWICSYASLILVPHLLFYPRYIYSAIWSIFPQSLTVAKHFDVHDLRRNIYYVEYEIMIMVTVVPDHDHHEPQSSSTNTEMTVQFLMQTWWEYCFKEKQREGFVNILNCCDHIFVNGAWQEW